LCATALFLTTAFSLLRILARVLPIHKGGDEREFIVTPSKGRSFCHGRCNAGGDMIELVAGLRSISVVQAAQEIARYFAVDPAHDGEEVEDEIINSPVGALRPKHEAVQALGIRPETAKVFGAGYSAELQGRFVIPIFDKPSFRRAGWAWRKEDFDRRRDLPKHSQRAGRPRRIWRTAAFGNHLGLFNAPRLRAARPFRVLAPAISG
jgi:hypothetical protein